MTNGRQPTGAAAVEVGGGELAELADALVASNDQLIALYRLAEFSVATLDAGDAATRTVEEARAVLGALSVAFVGPGPDGEMMVEAETGAPADHLLATAPPSGRGDRSSIAHDGGQGRSVLSVPVRAQRGRFGLLVAWSAPAAPFATGDLKLLEALANHLAVVLELSALHDERVEQAVMQRDHDTAAALARAAMHRTLPRPRGLDVAAVSRPARAAGGDFYAAARSDTGLFVALGDVSGKGLPSALIMTSAISATYSAFDRCPEGDPATVLEDVETQLTGYLVETGRFITMAVAHVEPATGRLLVSNAGQSPVAVVRRGVARSIPTDGPPIGVLDPRRHRWTESSLAGGDLLFIGSDGCTDQADGDDTMFGTRRVERVLSRPGTPAELLERLLEAVEQHGGGVAQADDLTAIAVRRSEKEPDR